MYYKKNLTKLEEMDGLAPQVMKTLLNLFHSHQEIATDNAHSTLGQDMDSQPDSTAIPNLEAVKARQKATWESGDFAAS